MTKQLERLGIAVRIIISSWIACAIVSSAAAHGEPQIGAGVQLNPTVEIGYTKTFSDDQKYLAVASADKKSIAVFVDVDGIRRLVRNIFLETSASRIFAMSPQGQVLAAVGNGGESIEVYSTLTGEKLEELSLSVFFQEVGYEYSFQALTVLDESGDAFLGDLGPSDAPSRLAFISRNEGGVYEGDGQAIVRTIAQNVEWYTVDHAKEIAYVISDKRLSAYSIKDATYRRIWTSKEIEFASWNSGMVGSEGSRSGIFQSATGGLFSDGNAIFLCTALDFGRQAWAVFKADSGKLLGNGSVTSSHPDDVAFLTSGCIGMDYSVDHFLIDRTVGAEFEEAGDKRTIRFVEVSDRGSRIEQREVDGPAGLRVLIDPLKRGQGSFFSLERNYSNLCSQANGFTECFEQRAPGIAVASSMDPAEKTYALSYQRDKLLFLDLMLGDVSVLDILEWVTQPNTMAVGQKTVGLEKVRAQEFEPIGPFGIGLGGSSAGSIYLKGVDAFISGQLFGGATAHQMPIDYDRMIDAETQREVDVPLDYWEAVVFAVNKEENFYARCNVAKEVIELLDLSSNRVISSSSFLPYTRPPVEDEIHIIADYCGGLKLFDGSSGPVAVFRNPSTQQLESHEFGGTAQVLFDRISSRFALADKGKTIFAASSSMEELGRYNLLSDDPVWSADLGDVIHDILLSEDEQTVHVLVTERSGRLSDRVKQYFFVSIDAATGEIVSRLELEDEPSHRPLMSWLPDSKFLIYQSSQEETIFYSVLSQKTVARLSFFDATGTWIAYTPSGFYDSNSPGSLGQLSWLTPERPLDPLPLEAFFREYYTPGLLGKILRGESLPDLPSIEELDRTQPELNIVSVEPATDETVVVRVSARSVGSEFEEDRFSGVEGLRLMRDGQLVGEALLDDDAIGPESGGVREIVFEDVQLPTTPGPSTVEFSAYAFSYAGIKSQTVRQQYEVHEVQPRRRRAYVLAVGVDAYDDPSWTLEYAAADAREYARRFSRGIEVDGEVIEDVSVIALVSDEQELPGEAAASAENIETVLRALAGERVAAAALERIPGLTSVSRVRPDDVVVIAFSGHGFASDGGQFYFLPQDIPPENGREITARLLERAISSRDFRAWLSAIDAGRFVMIIDACNSGASVAGFGGFRPGPLGSREFGQLAYDKKMTVLAASSAESVALESDQIGHGLLTYALLKEGVEGKLADSYPADGRVSVLEMLRYGEARVPALYEEISTHTFEPLMKGQRASVPVFADSGESHLSTGAFQPAMFNFSENELAEIGLR